MSGRLNSLSMCERLRGLRVDMMRCDLPRSSSLAGALEVLEGDGTNVARSTKSTLFLPQSLVARPCGLVAAR